MFRSWFMKGFGLIAVVAIVWHVAQADSSPCGEIADKLATESIRDRAMNDGNYIRKIIDLLEIWNESGTVRCTGIAQITGGHGGIYIMEGTFVDERLVEATGKSGGDNFRTHYRSR